MVRIELSINNAGIAIGDPAECDEPSPLSEFPGDGEALDHDGHAAPAHRRSRFQGHELGDF